MPTVHEELQAIFHRYTEAHGGLPDAPYKACQWALTNGLIEPMKIDPVAMLAGEMARALREEYSTDAKGRRYRRNHAIRITKNGIQYSLWAEVETAPRDHMIRAFQQRRRQIIGDCYQLKTDVDVYNDKHREMEQIPLVLDFTDDVAELQALETRGKAA